MGLNIYVIYNINILATSKGPYRVAYKGGLGGIIHTNGMHIKTQLYRGAGEEPQHSSQQATTTLPSPPSLRRKFSLRPDNILCL